MALPHVVRFNAEDPDCATIYATLARETSVCPADTEDPDAIAALIRRLQELLETTGFAGTWTSHGVIDPDITALASEAAQQWTAQFNPVSVDATAFEVLYLAAL